MYVCDSAVMPLPQACLVDLTPPTFAGITSLVPQVNGSLLAGWSAGSDATPPIEYEVYVQAGSATGLFSPANIAQIVRGLSARIFVLADDSRLVKGTTYFVGVRARDAVGNLNTNTVSLSAVSTGVLDDDLAAIAASLTATELDLASDHVDFQSDHANFQADHSDFQSDHANFQADHAAFQSDISALNDLIATIRNPDLVATLEDDDRIEAILNDNDSLEAVLKDCQ